MKEEKRTQGKGILKRMGLGLAQHLAAALLMVLLAWLLFHSFLTVNSMNGPKTYYLEVRDQGLEFEDSAVFQELYQTAVSDIIQLVMIRDQLETDGVLNLAKAIDVTDFLRRFGTEGKDYGNATALYELEELIKWGRYGVEYKARSMSMSDFVNYYQDACRPENFALDGFGGLYFKGYFAAPQESEEPLQLLEDQDSAAVEEKMKEYTRQQLEDMAFSYILGKAGKGISVSREDDGSLTVIVDILTCRYQTVDKKAQLFELAGDWIEFLQLQRNVEETISMLLGGYELYQNCISLYEDSRSNLKYVVRMRTRQGEMETFSNISVPAEMDDESLTEYFSDYRRYLIYYPDNLEFMGNTDLTEGDIYEYMREAQYPYPDDVYLWIGVDTACAATGDAFYYAGQMFDRIMPKFTWVLVAMALLLLFWLGLMVYLGITTVLGDGQEEPRADLLPYDRLWTEGALVLIACAGYGTYRGFLFLEKIAQGVYRTHMETMGESLEGVALQYGSFALFGFFTSLSAGIIVLSLIRRIKAGNLYRDSLLHFLLKKAGRLLSMIFHHQNAVINILLPYHIFLLLNLFAGIGTYLLRKQTLWMAVVLVGILAFDAFVGILLFVNSAEQSDIVEGMNRIRSGEVDYKLETEHLHGSNRELADAVNHIGQGIHNAVKTSMKDERLKTDLITNVSHDIKTPLTSIINYVDLLKRQNITQEPAKGYIEILDSKAQRLKDLTDDLVEASKISSGNIVLKLEKLNLGELLKQTIGEFSEKLEAKGLTIVAEIGENPGEIWADSRRMWRVMENLFYNICKYAMEGTRVYAELTVEGERVELWLKNISQAQMNIHAEELTERFIRGDSARATEGSGLGLFIAKSLTNAQDGFFEIDLDGDLFKVHLSFPLYHE